MQAWVPDHLEVKRAKLFGGFDETQGRVGFDDGTHAAGEGEYVGGAGKALQGDAEVGHADGGAAFEAEGCELFVGDGLDARKKGDDEVVGGDVLLEGEACAETAVAGDGTDPVFAIEVFGLKVGGEKDVVVGEEEIELTVFEHFFDGWVARGGTRR